MKLSVKWLAGLAVLVLAVVAVVGSTSATKAATGSIFVVNEWSGITNESPAPAGRTFRSSVYGTIDDGTGVRLIETDADLIRVVVKDSDLNLTVDNVVTDTADITVTSGGGTGEGGATDQEINAGIGQGAVIQLTSLSGTPIAGTLADVQANTIISTLADGDLVGTEISITNFFAGSGGSDPWISVVVNTVGPYTINQISYQTSTFDSVVVTVKSELDPTGVTVVAEETGLSSGVFEGFVQLVPSSSASLDGTAPSSLDGTPEPGTAGAIRTTVGPVNVTFDDGGTTRQSTVLVDTSAPTSTVTGPVDGTATQNKRPTFSGSISESGSGLDVSSIMVVYDDRDDATNLSPVATVSATAVTFPTFAPTSGVQDLAVNITGSADGDSAFSFSKAPGGDIPASLSNPDNIIDWVIRVSDLAGNISLSDADPSASGVQLHTVKVDSVLPTFFSPATNHVTGKANSSTGEVTARNSLRVVFNDQMKDVQKEDFTVTLKNSAVVVPVAVTVVNNPTVANGYPSGFANRGFVYLQFANDLVSDEAPTVALQGTVSDLAGNATATGSTTVKDGLGPKLTVTLSGGSGVGTGSEGPSKLTKEKITVEITSDESLSGSPVVEVFPTAGSPFELAPTALAQGANKWSATYSKPGGTIADGKRAVKVTGTDTNANSASLGSDDSSKSGTPNFTLDQTLAAASVSVGGGSSTTDQTRPSIVIDYKTPGEAHTVTLSKVLFDDVDITSDVVPSSDGKRFFYIPPTDLSLGDHTLEIGVDDAIDAANNKAVSPTTLTVTVNQRSTFNLEVFAGWNARSFPSDPIDPDINSVFSNAGHDAVLGFDPTVPGQWQVAIRDTVSNMLEPATENGLTSVRSTQAYWVHSLNFEPIEVLLIGETPPAAGSPPPIVTIPTVAGFNAVPVVDTSRKLTTGGSTALVRQVPGGGTPTAVTVSDYLGNVTEGRVYVWEPQFLTYSLLDGSSAVNTGDVLFVEVTGTPVPIFP